MITRPYAVIALLMTLLIAISSSLVSSGNCSYLMNSVSSINSGEKLLNLSGTSNSVAVVVSDKLKCAIKYLRIIYELAGVNYRFYSMKEVLTMFPRGREDESLRAFAKYIRYVKHFRYLVIVGDDIDYAYIYMKDRYSGIEGALKATDMYYSLLDHTWDPNHDGYLLEFIDLNNDGIPEAIEKLKDLTPDLIVTRLPFSTCSEVKDYVYSILKSLSRGSNEFSTLLVATILKFPGEGTPYLVDGASVDELIKDLILHAVLNAEVTTMYEGSGVLKSRCRYDLPINSSNFERELRKGYSLIMIISHGNGMKLARYVWISDRNHDGVFEINELATPVYASYDSIPKLGYASLIYLDTCLAGATDLMGKKALAHTLLLRGASAVIAPTRTTYFSNYVGRGLPRLSQELMYLYVKYLLSTYPNLDPAVAFYESRAAYMRKYLSVTQSFDDVKDVLTYVFFGDPIASKLVINVATHYLRTYGTYLIGNYLMLGIRYGSSLGVNTYLLNLRNGDVNYLLLGDNHLLSNGLSHNELIYYLPRMYLVMKLLGGNYSVINSLIK